MSMLTVFTECNHNSVLINTHQVTVQYSDHARHFSNWCNKTFITITVLVSGWWKWFFRVNDGAVRDTHLVIKNFCHSQVANIKTVRPSVAILCSIWWSPLPWLPESAAPWPCQNIGGLTQFLFPLLGHDGPKLGLPRWSPWWKFGSCLTPDGCENRLTCW